MLAGAAVAMGAPLAACGFRPMYGRANTSPAGISVDHQMAGIQIDPIANRLGQQLHNALRDRFNPLGQPSSSAYTLQVSLNTRTYGALTKPDLSASRRNVELNAFYYLRDTSGNVLLQERSVITTGYDEFDDPLNDISAFEDAERRGTLQLAEQIRTRVAVYLTAGTVPPELPEAAAPAATTTPAGAAPAGTPFGSSPSTTAPASASPYSNTP